MSKAKDDYYNALESEIDLDFNEKSQKYITELESLLKECITDKDILKYNNMELEQQKAELIELLIDVSENWERMTIETYEKIQKYKL